jgi:hypothetical protein
MVLIGGGTALCIYAAIALAAVDVWVKRGGNLEGIGAPRAARPVVVVPAAAIPQAPPAADGAFVRFGAFAPWALPGRGEPAGTQKLPPGFLPKAAGAIAAGAKNPPIVGLATLGDLKDVPEISLQDSVPRSSQLEILSAIGKIHMMNERETDGFIKALIRERADLAGLPFALGDACRKTEKESWAFTQAVWEVRRSRRNRGGGNETVQARIAALMQILAPAPEHLRTGLAENLASISDVAATRALAKLAVFSLEDDVRKQAMEGLKLRREKDYTDILVEALHYPWPPFARHAAEVIAKIERTDLIPQLIAVLERPDPRLAALRKVADKSELVLRELVRVNHHRNCLLCHAPAVDGSDNAPPEVPRSVLTASVLTASVPVPGKPLPPTLVYYRERGSGAVRVDITYLRQDFSLLQPVSDAAPWPEMQRFDFFVRTRTVTDQEARAHGSTLAKRLGGLPNPYHEAALAALRQLSGRDAGPTSQAWRKLAAAGDGAGRSGHRVEIPRGGTAEGRGAARNRQGE